VFLDFLQNRREDVLEEVDDAVEVELGAQQVEENILAVTLVQLRH